MNSTKRRCEAANIDMRSSDPGDTIDRGCFGIELAKRPWMKKKQEKDDDHKNDIMIDSGTVDSTQNDRPLVFHSVESRLVPQLPSWRDHLHLLVVQIHVGTGIDHEDEIPTAVDAYLFARLTTHNTR